MQNQYVIGNSYIIQHMDVNWSVSSLGVSKKWRYIGISDLETVAAEITHDATGVVG